jgi:hypothetical protein
MRSSAHNAKTTQAPALAKPAMAIVRDNWGFPIPPHAGACKQRRRGPPPLGCYPGNSMTAAADSPPIPIITISETCHSCMGYPQNDAPLTAVFCRGQATT